MPFFHISELVPSWEVDLGSGEHSPFSATEFWVEASCDDSPCLLLQKLEAGPTDSPGLYPRSRYLQFEKQVH